MRSVPGKTCTNLARMFPSFVFQIMGFMAQTQARNFLQDHLSHLFAFSPKVHGRWQRSWLMGLSCWFYAFPGIICFFMAFTVFADDPLRQFLRVSEGLLYGMTAFNSFLADHVYLGITHYSHAFDRISATLSAVSIATKVFTTTFTLFEFTVFAALWITALSMLLKSRQSKTQRDFVWNHFMWHLVGSLGMCWVLWIQYKNHRESDTQT